MGNQNSQTLSSSTKIDNNITLKINKAKHGFPFPAREGCVACGVDGKVYIFGGVIQTDGQEPKETNELFVFDIVTEEWKEVQTIGVPPLPRAAASLVVIGTKLYLFGGLSHAIGWFDDLFTFDIVTGTWSDFQTEGSKPRPRDKLQAVAIGTNIYYFGGFGPKTDGADIEDDDDEEETEDADIPEAEEQEGAEFGWFNDLYVLDTVGKRWSQPMHMNLGVPSPRAAHGMCAVGDNIYIFGGRDIQDRQNDLHIFNIVTRKWDTHFNAKGMPPEPRSFHTTTAVGSRVVVIGGRGRNNSHFADIHLFDTETHQWLQPQATGALGEARGQHVAVVTGQFLVVFGGTGQYSDETMQCQQFYKDTFLINTEDILRGGAKASLEESTNVFSASPLHNGASS